MKTNLFLRKVAFAVLCGLLWFLGLATVDFLLWLAASQEAAVVWLRH